MGGRGEKAGLGADLAASSAHVRFEFLPAEGAQPPVVGQCAVPSANGAGLKLRVPSPRVAVRPRQGASAEVLQ